MDPELARQVQRSATLGAGILACHVADWATRSTDVLHGRLIPRDGALPLRDIVRMTRDAGYRGPLEAEVLNPAVWRQDPYAVAARCAQRLAALDAGTAG